jgi:catechol 2,3-dioxygenase-like lactoylglutathione lyase family enzyme
VRVWYHVRDLERARAFYTQLLGFTETFVDEEEQWIALDRGETQIALAEGEPAEADEGGVAAVDVESVKSERERLAEAGVEVGTALELHGAIRVLDVFDPDGNRIQLTEDVE